MKDETPEPCPAVRGNETVEPTRRVSVAIPESAYEQLRTAAIRLDGSNADVIAEALAEFVSKRQLMPLEGAERERLRKRGELTPEQLAEWEEEQRVGEEVWRWMGANAELDPIGDLSSRADSTRDL